MDYCFKKRECQNCGRLAELNEYGFCGDCGEYEDGEELEYCGDCWSPREYINKNESDKSN